MTELKDAFAGIAPIDWSDVPKDSLPSVLKANFAAAEILANSVPLGPSTDSSSERSSAKAATTAAETVVSPHPTELDTRHAESQKPWGKPIKINAKDNPLNVSVYKTAGHDRRGSWFARRSVHAGLSYAKWKNAMKREFPTSLKVKAGPGSGAVRGIAGDKRLEKEAVDGVGNAEVWLLSSSFPGPVNPRDFVSLISTSDQGLSEVSATSGKIPRHLIVVSRPTSHPEAEEREGLVRGNYESMELMREIPGTGQDEESNLIEWIMITRSDPGGGIPRFMVDRGTPGSIVADVPKFIEWAISRSEDDDEKDDAEAEKEIEEANAQGPDLSQSEPNLRGGDEESAQEPMSKSVSMERPSQVPRQPSLRPEETTGNSSLLGSLTSAIGSTVGGYIYGDEYEHHQGRLNQVDPKEASDSSSISSSSDGTFASAADYEDRDAPSGDDASSKKGSDGASILSGRSEGSSERPLSPHEKEMLKLKKKRIDLDQRMAKTREADEKRSQDASTKEKSEQKKAEERIERDRKKQEEKYQKEVRNLEERRKKQERKAEESRVKEGKRAEERKRKALEKDALYKTQRERDEAKESLKIAEGEREALVQQVADLQRENTLLVQKLGSTEAGVDALN